MTRTVAPQRPAARREPTTARRQPVPVRVTRRGRGPRGRRRYPSPSLWRAGRPVYRLTTVLVVCSVVLALLVVRVASLQTVDRHRYSAFGARQRLDRVTLTADRGTIYDRNHLEMALSAPQTTIWADPRTVLASDNPNGVVNTLVSVLGFDAARADRLRQAIIREGSAFAYVARQVDVDTAQKVLALKLPGIATLTEPKRFTPSGELASSTVGAADPDGIGISGIEKKYDEMLTGTPGVLVFEHDSRGRTIPFGHHELVPAMPGESLELTIDQTITYAVEKMLLDRVREIGAKGGEVTVLDRVTGDVIAVASVDTDPTTHKPEISSRNRPFVDSFEPGSVMKIVPVAASLDSGVSELDTSWHLEGLVESGDDEIHNAETSRVRDLTLRAIISQSDNIGAVRLGQELGKQRMEDYLRAFGFGSKSAVAFPDESGGILPPNAKWYGSQKDTIAYGQGVSITQVQLAAAMNTIANGGLYVAPRLVRGTVDANGTEVAATASPSRQVISSTAAADMTQALIGVVCRKDGTVGSHRLEYLNLPGYQVAGKTGTGYKAQNKGIKVKGRDGKLRTDDYVYRTDQGGLEHKYIASFAGFLPADNPRLTIAVTIDEPPVGPYRFGATAAAPLCARIGAEAMRLLAVPPSPDGVVCPTEGT